MSRLNAPLRQPHGDAAKFPHWPTASPTLVL
jgi:hypothetical protein